MTSQMAKIRPLPFSAMAMTVLTAALTMPPWASGQQPGTAVPEGQAPRRTERLTDNLFAYLNVASMKTGEFRPLTQADRNRLFGRSLINPLWYAKAAVSS